MLKKDNIINTLYPLFLGVIITMCTVVINLFVLKGYFYTLKGFSDVLSSTIGFSSILIGFYTAMYSILLMPEKSFIVDKIIKEDRKLFEFQLYTSLGSSFIFLIISMIMQITINYPKHTMSIVISYIWIFMLGYFMGSSFRGVTLLLKIMFSQGIPKRKNSNDGETSVDYQKKKEKINNQANK